MKSLATGLVCAALLLAPAAHGQEDDDHFEGAPSESLEEAIGKCQKKNRAAKSLLKRST